MSRREAEYQTSSSIGPMCNAVSVYACSSNSHECVTWNEREQGRIEDDRIYQGCGGRYWDVPDGEKPNDDLIEYRLRLIISKVKLRSSIALLLETLSTRPFPTCSCSPGFTKFIANAACTIA